MGETRHMSPRTLQDRRIQMGFVRHAAWALAKWDREVNIRSQRFIGERLGPLGGGLLWEDIRRRGNMTSSEAGRVVPMSIAVLRCVRVLGASDLAGKARPVDRGTQFCYSPSLSCRTDM